MKILCIGRNYAEHARELNNPLPTRPLVFIKPSTALLVNDKPFYIPEFTQDVHHEIELVLKICKNGRHVQTEFAHRYYDQIGLGIDFTARDVQQQCKEKGHPWEIAKAFDNSAPVSTFIDKNELPEPNEILFRLNKNGKTVQSGNTADLIFPFDEIIAYVSQYFTLHIGDLIYTGTPAGVGAVAIGDELQAFLTLKDGSEQMMLQCQVR